MKVRGLLVVLTLALVVCRESPGIAQSLPAGTARSANGVLVVVRSDGVENHLQGRRALQLFEGDTLRIDGKGEALIETDEGHPGGADRQHRREDPVPVGKGTGRDPDPARPTG